MRRNQPTDVRNLKPSLLRQRSHGRPTHGVGHVQLVASVAALRQAVLPGAQTVALSFRDLLV